MVHNFKDYAVDIEFIVLKDTMVTMSQTISISDEFLELPNKEPEAFVDGNPRRSLFAEGKFVTLIDGATFKQLTSGGFLRELES